MPMHRCIQSAAGGTSQRLKLGPATVRSFARMSAPAPACGIAPDTLDMCPPVFLRLRLAAAFYSATLLPARIAVGPPQMQTRYARDFFRGAVLPLRHRTVMLSRT